MKMRKSTSKILSLVLVLSFVFSLSAVTASAADTNEQDELVTFILEYDKNCEVYELSDGTTVVRCSHFSPSFVNLSSLGSLIIAARAQCNDCEFCLGGN